MKEKMVAQIINTKTYSQIKVRNHSESIKISKIFFIDEMSSENNLHLEYVNQGLDLIEFETTYTKDSKEDFISFPKMQKFIQELLKSSSKNEDNTLPLRIRVSHELVFHGYLKSYRPFILKVDENSQITEYKISFSFIGRRGEEISQRPIKKEKRKNEESKKKKKGSQLYYFIFVPGTTVPLNEESSKNGKNRSDSTYWNEHVFKNEFESFLEDYSKENNIDIINTKKNKFIDTTFSWSGKNLIKDRGEAGENLSHKVSTIIAKIKEKYNTNNINIHLLSHSHGGQLINEMINHTSEENLQYLASLTYLSTPFFQKDLHFPKKSVPDKCQILNIYNKFDLTQTFVADLNLENIYKFIEELKSSEEWKNVRDSFRDFLLISINIDSFLTDHYLFKLRRVISELKEFLQKKVYTIFEDVNPKKGIWGEIDLIINLLTNIDIALAIPSYQLISYRRLRGLTLVSLLNDDFYHFLIKLFTSESTYNQLVKTKKIEDMDMDTIKNMIQNEIQNKGLDQVSLFYNFAKVLKKSIERYNDTEFCVPNNYFDNCFKESNYTEIDITEKDPCYSERNMELFKILSKLFETIEEDLKKEKDPKKIISIYSKILCIFSINATDKINLSFMQIMMKFFFKSAVNLAARILSILPGKKYFSIPDTIETFCEHASNSNYNFRFEDYKINERLYKKAPYYDDLSFEELEEKGINMNYFMKYSHSVSRHYLHEEIKDFYKKILK